MIAATALFVVAPRDPDAGAWRWAGIAVVGVAALTGHRLLVAAYHWGRASDLAPLGYLGLVWAFAIGATVFIEPLMPRALFGAAAIAFGGIIALRAGPPDDLDIPVSVDYGDPVDRDRTGPDDSARQAPVRAVVPVSARCPVVLARGRR